MKRLTLLIAAIAMVALPALAAPPAGRSDRGPAQLSEQSRKFQREVIEKESRERKLHKAFFQNYRERLARRDAAMQVRERNIRNNSPGNTGM